MYGLEERVKSQMDERPNAFLRVWGDWQRNVHSGVGLKIGKIFIMDCCVACMVFFADEYFVVFLICEFMQRPISEQENFSPKQ